MSFRTPRQQGLIPSDGEIWRERNLPPPPPPHAQRGFCWWLTAKSKTSVCKSHHREQLIGQHKLKRRFANIELPLFYWNCDGMALWGRNGIKRTAACFLHHGDKRAFAVDTQHQKQAVSCCFHTLSALSLTAKLAEQAEQRSSAFGIPLTQQLGKSRFSQLNCFTSLLPNSQNGKCAIM